MASLAPVEQAVAVQQAPQVPAVQPPPHITESAAEHMSVAPPQPQTLATPTKPTVPEAAQLSEELYEKVKKLFPSYEREGLLRFSSLLGLGRPSCLPKIWAGARKPKRKKQKQEPQDGWEGEDKSEHWTLDLGGTPPRELVASDDEDWLLSGTDDRHSQKGAGRKRGRSGGRKCAWRHGPAKYWYDQLNVPEDGSNFDYGFKLKVCWASLCYLAKLHHTFTWLCCYSILYWCVQSPPQRKGEVPDDEGKPLSDDSLPDDAFYMVAQYPWENDIIYDASPQSADSE